jgi:hypothetical protein
MREKNIQIFNTNLEKYIKLINGTMEETELEDIKKFDLWIKNLYGRYAYAKSGDHKGYQLAQEHMDKLLETLNNLDITEEEYKNAKGNRKKLNDIYKMKHNVNNNQKTQNINYDAMTLEELEEKIDKNIGQIIDLKKKETERYKQLYGNPSETLEEIHNQIKKLKEENKKICNVINKKKEQIKQPNEIDITRPKSSYQQRMISLIEENDTLEQQIEELKQEKAEYENRIKEIRGNYENRLNGNKDKLEKEYQKKLETQTEKIAAEYDKKSYEETEKHSRILEEERKKYNEIIQKQQNQSENNLRKLQNQFKEDKKQEKEELEDIKIQIIRLIKQKGKITIDEIVDSINSNKPKDEKIKKAKEALNTLRILIPGIKRTTKNGELAFEKQKSAHSELDKYKNLELYPSIYNDYNGEVKFIVRSDLHININSKESDIKRLFHPYLNYCSINNNIPIIDLGDVIDGTVKFQKCKKNDIEHIESAYTFYKNYAKAINEAPKIKHYMLLGNHDAYAYQTGIDPQEIINEYSCNIENLGLDKGAFEIANDKICVYHAKLPSKKIVNAKTPQEKDEIIYNSICQEIDEITKDYIYSLIGHFHIAMNNPLMRFSTIGNGIDNSLLFEAEINHGHVEKMFVQELIMTNDNRIRPSSYKTEIYNRRISQKIK